MEKKCNLCEEIKLKSEFCKKGLLRSGKIKLASICKTCNSKKCKDNYRKNKQHHLKLVTINKQKHRSIKKNFLEQTKKINGCALCDEKECCCMDFHHLYNKKFLISRSDKSMEKIREELKKCVCLCSNCHRKVHNNILKVDEQDLCKLPE
jgi:hypothetical protein